MSPRHKDITSTSGGNWVDVRDVATAHVNAIARIPTKGLLMQSTRGTEYTLCCLIPRRLACCWG
ncbi:hypothetical protein JB92DRAFT_2870216 [Gautieria morchelliformis]|nr:hypothetical protein JB92DRAFT_2870216 [Gautieria morchelliformis]